MNELIERQATIDAVNNAFDRETLLTGFVRSIAVRAIRDMPSVQPEVLACGNGELVATPEPAYEQVEEYCKRRCLHVVTDDFFESTKPQRLGHWILYDKRFPWRTWYKCSECGNYLDFSGVNGGRGEVNYCPNCGARMKGEPNERTD